MLSKISTINVMLRLVFKIWSILQCVKNVDSIGCYKCSTLDNDTACVDPFNPGITSAKGNGYYEHDCKSAVDERIGLFPARFCLKISGYKDGTKEQVVIRTCTVTKLYEQEEGGGSLYSFSIEQADGSRLKVVSGFISSCRFDGCNKGNLLSAELNSYFLTIFFVIMSITCKFYF